MHPGVLVKAAVTPVLIGSAAWAGRRYGDAVAGWLVGLPLTSAPILLFISLERGTAFASLTAVGILAGALSQTAFALAYGWASVRWNAVFSGASGTVVFAVATAVLASLRVSTAVTVGLVLLGLVLAIRLIPGSRDGRPARRAPAWDIPLRMVLATALVLLLTSAAPLLGPRLTGLLSPFPIFAGAMTVFAHQSGGADAARDVLRGLLFGMFAFAAFFLVAALTLVPLGIAATFVLATAAALTAHGVGLAVLRRAL